MARVAARALVLLSVIMALVIIGYTAVGDLGLWKDGYDVSWSRALLFYALVGALPAAAFHAGVQGRYGSAVLGGTIAVAFLLLLVGLNVGLASR